MILEVRKKEKFSGLTLQILIQIQRGMMLNHQGQGQGQGQEQSQGQGQSQGVPPSPVFEEDEPMGGFFSFPLIPPPSSSSSREDHHVSSIISQSLLVSSANLWAWGDQVNDECIINKKTSIVGGDHHHHHHHHHHQLGLLSAMNMKMKKTTKSRRKVREPRFCFKTMSDVDVLDDGYKWRKYGQKVVKNTQHPRSYYRCTQDSCRVKKRVERLAEDPRMVITTYEGRHAHSPSHDIDDPSSGGGLGLNNFNFNFFC